MLTSDRSEFMDLLTAAMAFYRRDVSKFALSVWWAACEPFELEQVAKALTAHATDPDRGQFPPMPADIVKQLRGTSTDRALLAWARLYEAMQRQGAYRSVAFDDRAIHAAVSDLGGWVTLCRTLTDDLPHVQRRFTECYRVYAKREFTDYPTYLPGESELSNRVKGHAVPPPVQLTNAQQKRIAA